MKNKTLGKKLQTGQTVRILCFLCLALVLSGCPSVKHWDCMPENAPQQLRYMLDEKDDMLMIPLILTEKVLLGTMLNGIVFYFQEIYAGLPKRISCLW